MTTVKDRLKKESFGYVTAADMPALVKENPNYRLLVKCGSGRFVVCADQAEHFIQIISESNRDYVRDVSFVVEN